MLKENYLNSERMPQKQQGVVLVIALILLIAMTLGGIAMIRSVYTTNIIAGNLSFKEAATSSADAGIEAGIQWLLSPTPGCVLTDHCFGAGYSAVRTVKDPMSSWDDFWDVLKTADQVQTLPTDTAGNTVSYAIERLCNEIGNFADANCSTASAMGGASGNPHDNVDPLHPINKVYYRITSKVVGPRNTVSYVQAIVSL